MSASSRRVLFGGIALACAAAFVALGVWQMDRHRGRQEEIRRTGLLLERPPLLLGVEGGHAVGPGGPEAEAGDGERAPEPPQAGEGSGGKDGARTVLPAPDSAAWRRMVARGRMAYGREVVLAPRSYRGGTPGVYLLTPLLLDDSVAVPVLRGSMPAPDGFHARLEKARPAWARPAAGGASDASTEAGPGGRPGGASGREEAAASGRPVAGARSGEAPLVTVYGVALPPPDVEAAAAPDTLHAAGGVHPVLRHLDLERVRELLPYPTAGFYLRADSTTEAIPPADGIRLPAPVPPAELDEGPHLTYAVQWFAFAAIALVGGGIVAFRRGAGA